ncbi:MAG: beta-glucosidase [Anaerolineaceae bacterium]|nr:beta-glucosidase [Anaerolineaceae bacterium]
MADKRIFPDDFVWGAATAAYQIEGAVNEGGRGKSIWDTFSHTPGKINNGDTGDVACDHYHRWQDDIALMKQINLEAYRFSIAWSRILPTGRGHINQAGLDFYSALVDGLLAADITPFVTLYHWDLPQALQDDGDGWQRRGIVDDYLAYVDIVSRTLGDRVQYWSTFNEPWVFSWSGYYFGEDAPGWQNGIKAALTTTHHALLAHGRAVPLLRQNVANAKVGIALDMNVAEPATDKPKDVAAAMRFDGFQNRWYLGPLFRGNYPEDMLELYAGNLPDIHDGDLAQINVPIDYLGINFYRRSVMAAGEEVPPVNYRRVSPSGDYTEMGSEVSPQGLYDIMKYVYDHYDVPDLYITENGAAFKDEVSADQKVHDTKRVDYLYAHFGQAQRAIEDGIPLKGYFVWSLLDNFEWAYGYQMRFGLVYVDYETQRRIIKDSGHYLAQVIRQKQPSSI